MEWIEATGKTVDEAVKSALSTLGLAKEAVEVEVIDRGSRGILGFVGTRHARVRVAPVAKTAEPPSGKSVAPDKADRPEKLRSVDDRAQAGPAGRAGGSRIGAGNTVRAGEGELSRPSAPSGAVRSAVIPAEDGEVDGGRGFLEKLISIMGLHATVTERGGDEVTVLDVQGKSLGALIGRHGETLDAVQYLVNLAANKNARVSGESGRARYVVDVAGYRQKREEALQDMAREIAAKVVRDHKSQALEPMSALERRVVHVALQGVGGVSTHSEGREPYRRIVISPLLAQQGAEGVEDM